MREWFPLTAKLRSWNCKILRNYLKIYYWKTQKNKEQNKQKPHQWLMRTTKRTGCNWSSSYTSWVPQCLVAHFNKCVEPGPNLWLLTLAQLSKSHFGTSPHAGHLFSAGCPLWRRRGIFQSALLPVLFTHAGCVSRALEGDVHSQYPNARVLDVSADFVSQSWGACSDHTDACCNETWHQASLHTDFKTQLPDQLLTYIPAKSMITLLHASISPEQQLNFLQQATQNP
jgi:hypothetical protein